MLHYIFVVTYRRWEQPVGPDFKGQAVQINVGSLLTDVWEQPVGPDFKGQAVQINVGSLLTFGNNLSVQTSRVKQSK